MPQIFLKIKIDLQHGLEAHLRIFSVIILVLAATLSLNASVPLLVRYDYSPPITGEYHFQRFTIGYENNSYSDLFKLGAALKLYPAGKPKFSPIYTLLDAENYIVSKSHEDEARIEVFPNIETSETKYFHYFDFAVIDNRPSIVSNFDIDWVRGLYGYSFLWHNAENTCKVHGTPYFGVAYKSLQVDAGSFDELAVVANKEYSGFAITAGVKGTFAPRTSIEINPNLHVIYHFAGMRILKASAETECKIMLCGNELFQRHSLIIRCGLNRLQLYNGGRPTATLNYANISIGLLFRFF